MCTMSWLRGGASYDVFFNRDEKRSRAPAGPPEEQRTGRTRILAPRDGEAGGSWIAVNEHCVSIALLNGYAGSDAAEAPGGGWVSRGHLVTELGGCKSAAEVTRQLESTDLGSFRTFHVIALDPGDERMASWRPGDLDLAEAGSFGPLLVSSSYRFEEVAASRRERYAAYLEVGGGSVESALAYHRSHTPERGPFSPCMHRDDARTVSFTWIHVDAEQATMRYSPDAPCRSWPPEEALRISRARAREREESRGKSSTIP